MSLARLLRISRLRFRSLTQGSAVDNELHRELVFHFDQLVADHIADGMSPGEAKRAAHRELGNVAALEEYCRDERRIAWFDDLRQDIVYGVRMLRKHAGLTAIAVLSLAIGIGANAAVLGAFDALILQDLPLPSSDRLMAISSRPLDNPGDLRGLSLQEFVAYRDRSQSFDAMGAAIKWSGDLQADGPDAGLAERVVGQLATPEWLTILGIRPEIGRVFSTDENPPGAPQPIVLSHTFWQQRFGGDKAVLGRTLRFDGGLKVVVGVMPAEYGFQERGIAFWSPLRVAAQPDAGARLFSVRARLKPGVSPDRAQAELSGIAAQLAADVPQSKGWGVRLRTLKEALFGWAFQPLLTFQAAVALVLLIACANVAALLLSRASVRQREVALRAALGASRGRIIRQLLTESMLLALAGGALGLLVAFAGQQALLAMTTPPGSPALSAIDLNLRVVGILTLLTLGTGVACGLVPAIRGSRLDPMSSLKEPNLSEPLSRRRWFPRGALVSLQLALALALLVVSGLLLNSFIRLVWRDLNFDPAGLVRFEYNVPVNRFAQRIGTHDGFPYFAITRAPSQELQRVLDRVRSVPGVEAAAGISAPPVDAFVLANMEVQLESSARTTSSVYFMVTPNLFATLRTPIVRGRDFTEGDAAGTPWVAIVNETCARQLWPGEDAIGKRITMRTVPEEQPREVIAVVRDIPTRHANPAEAVIYASYLQQPPRYRAPWAALQGQMLFMVRGRDPDSLIPSLRSAVGEIDPKRAGINATTVESGMRNANGQFRYYVILVSIFAAVATLLAAIGTYGVMAYAVNLRIRELGIRRALGADRREVIALIGRRALALIGSGLVGGVVGAIVFARLIASRLWGVTPTDPATFAGVSAILVLTAAVACIAPVRRALRVDPTIALRSE